MTEPLTRKQLYNLVWKKPMVEVAKEYGLSDRGMAKLCEHHSVPTPPRGYWAKKAAGYKVKKPPLLFMEEKEATTFVLFNKAASAYEAKSKAEQEPEALPDEIEEAIAKELLPKNKIKAPKSLNNPHPIVKGWIAEEERRYSCFGYRSLKPNPSSAERRKHRIVSSLLYALEARSFKTYVDHVESNFVLIYQGRDHIGFSISEIIRQTRRVVTEEGESSSNGKKRWTVERVPSGLLRLKLSNSNSSWSSLTYEEKDDYRIEGDLNNIIVSIIKLLWKRRKDRILEDQAYQERQIREAEQKRIEEERRKLQERKDKLYSQAQDIQKAKAIRGLANTIEKAFLNGEIPADKQTIDEWKEWAHACADELERSIYTEISGRQFES